MPHSLLQRCSSTAVSRSHLKKVSARQGLRVRKNWTFRPGTGHHGKARRARKFCELMRPLVDYFARSRRRLQRSCPSSDLKEPTYRPSTLRYCCFLPMVTGSRRAFSFLSVLSEAAFQHFHQVHDFFRATVRMSFHDTFM